MFVRLIPRAAFAVALLTVPALAAAQAKLWANDTGHSKATFTVQAGPMTVDGSFGYVHGIVKWDDTDVTQSSVEEVVDICSLTTGDGKRETYLKSPDFFGGATFHQMVFKSTAVSKSDKGLKVEGDLKIHGVTKPVTFDVTDITMPGPGETKRKLDASTTLNRLDFGVGMGMADATISDEVKVTLHLELQPVRPNNGLHDVCCPSKVPTVPQPL
jgi:polyisoprenoid-binding protein YceI